MKKSANRLLNESSTYLLQHAHNPVDWYPWGEEALNKAKSLDKPILLSIGYSACHWCHVMEEESFEDIATAQIINENFIPIKVDREERQDIDDIYMTAVQLITGHGGWPLTVFLTPEQKPFYGGTYFPKEDKHYGQNILPGFKTVLKAISTAWQEKRSEIEASGEHLTHSIIALTQSALEKESLGFQNNNSEETLLINCANKIMSFFDQDWGGLNGAPKFPQTLCLQLCLDAVVKLKKTNKTKEAEQLLKTIDTSLTHMAQGGIYDQLGGGFARYSTDTKWLIPHFEKMLYDNALLVEIYANAFSVTKKEYWRQITCETLDFIARELTSEESGFYSSLDADSEGSEGKFYVWTKEEIKTILGPQAELLCQAFGITEQGNFENSENILHIKDNNLLQNNFKEIRDLKAKLFAHREKRKRPTRDDKILTSWNSLAISAFIKGYQITNNEKYLQLAKNGAQFILNKLTAKGKLKRSYAKGSAKLNGYLDDYAFFCQALLDLSSVDENPIWSSKAIELTDFMITHFFNEMNTDFYYTSTEHEKLITRPKNYLDGPVPSATSVAILNLLKLELITNDKKYSNLAKNILENHKAHFFKHPIQYANMIIAFDFSKSLPLSILLVKGPDNEQNEEILSILQSQYLPNKVIIVKDNEKSYHPELQLFQQKSIVESKATVFICQDGSCRPPVSDPSKIKTILNDS